jgi:hypothetical protein
MGSFVGTRDCLEERGHACRVRGGPSQPTQPIVSVPVPSYPQTLGVSVTVAYSVH